MTLPPRAVEIYEALRIQVLSGGRCRTGITALMYHGMAGGLALIAARPTSSVPQQETPVNAIAVMAGDAALVRLLANMVLHMQSEVQHVY